MGTKCLRCVNGKVRVKTAGVPSVLESCLVYQPDDEGMASVRRTQKLIDARVARAEIKALNGPRKARKGGKS